MAQIIDESSFTELLKVHPKLEAFLTESPALIEGKHISLAKLIHVLQFTSSDHNKDITIDPSKIKFTQAKQYNGKFEFVNGTNISILIDGKVNISSKPFVTINKPAINLQSIQTIKYIYVSALLHKFGMEHLDIVDLDFFYEKLKERIFTTDMANGNKILLSFTEDFIEQYNEGDRIEKEYTHISIIPKTLVHEKSGNPAIVRFTFKADFIAPENHNIIKHNTRGIPWRPN